MPIKGESKLSNGNLVKEFIEDNYLIDDAVTGEYRPFVFNPVQVRYYRDLVNDYGTEFWFGFVDELITKARKEGFTSIILGIFGAVMQLYPQARRFLEISYREDATVQHFRRIKRFVLSSFSKNPKNWTEAMDREIFQSVTEGSEFVLKDNGASFYVGSATSRTGQRGGTVQGVLFTESAHYPDTGV